MKNKKLIKFTQLMGVVLLFASFLTLALAFIGAYRQPTKETIMAINYFGEANFEMWVLIPLNFIFGLLALLITIKEVESVNLASRKTDTEKIDAHSNCKIMLRNKDLKANDNIFFSIKDKKDAENHLLKSMALQNVEVNLK